MKLGAPAIAAVALCAALLIATALLLLENGWLSGRLAETSAALDRAGADKAHLESSLASARRTISERERQVGNLTTLLMEREAELDATAARLEQARAELNTTREELEKSATSLAQAQEQFAALRENLTAMEDSLSQDVQWFRDNSRLTPSTDYFSRYVEDKCVDSGTLNMGCVSLFMQKRLGFSYIDEQNDRLYSIDEMVGRGGGDCEDYSLFVKALLNSLAGDGSLRLLGWKAGAGHFTVYRSSGGGEWYYSGDGTDLGTLASRPYVICYLTSLYGQLPLGHCIVALASGEIESVEGLGNLGGAVAFEPQNGEYVGRIGTDYHLCVNGDRSCGGNAGEIFTVMTNDDLYEFKEGRWESFGTYRAQAEALRKRLAATRP